MKLKVVLKFSLKVEMKLFSLMGTLNLLAQNPAIHLGIVINLWFIDIVRDPDASEEI